MGHLQHDEHLVAQLLAHQGEPVLGVVLLPEPEELWFGVLPHPDGGTAGGEGEPAGEAWRENRDGERFPACLSPRRRCEQLVLVASRSHRDERLERLVAELAIVDPELTRTLPPRLTAYSGMVAFFNAVGAILGTSRQPAGDLLALEAIQIISRFLAGAVTDDADPNARTMLSWAGTAAGMCTALTPVSFHQVLAQAASAAAPGLPHGAALAMLAPTCFNRLETGRPARDDLLADAMGVPSEAGPESGRQRFLTGLRHLVRSVGLAGESLADYGLGPVAIPLLARKAFDVMNALPDAAPAVPARPAIEAILAAAMARPSVGAATDRESLSAVHPDQQRRHFHGT